MEIPYTMINDAIKQLAGYKYYNTNKAQSEEDNAEEESEEHAMFRTGKGRGKGYMCLGDQEVNVSSKPKKDDVPRKKRTITYANNLLEIEDEAILLAKLVSTKEQRRQQQGIMTQLVIEKEVNIEVEEAFAAEKGMKLKGIAIEDPAVQSLLDLQKGSKESRLESIRQEIQPSKGEGSNAAKDGEFEDFSGTDSDATQNSSWSNTDKDDDIDDAENSDMDISDDDSDKGDDAVGYGDFINHLNDPRKQELTDLLSRAVFTNAQTTTMLANLKGNLEEMFEDASDHQVSSPLANTTHNLIINLQQSSIQAKAKKLITKARHTKLNFKKAVKKKFKEYDHKLETLSSINFPKAIEESVQANVLSKIKKQLPTHVLKAVSTLVKPCINKTVLEIVMENPNHLNEPNEAIPKVNRVVPEPNQVVDIHDPNEMVDIPDDIDLVDYDQEDPEEDPKEEPEEEPEEDVDIELEDDAKLIFPYEVEGDKTPPPGDVSSDSVSSDSESEDKEVDVAPEATAGTITQKPYAILDFSRGLFEVGESSSARDSSHVDGLAQWALRRDLEASRAQARVMEAELGTCQTEIALLKSKDTIREEERELLNHDLENVEHALGNVLERMSVLESEENATLKKRLAETGTKLA
ncbi:hypothetical protein Tco_0930669, partial [Tanacetum coccineum]